MLSFHTTYLETEIGQICHIIIKHHDGQSIEFTNYGGIIHAWHCKNKNGAISDVLLGRKQVTDYLQSHPYFGSITGRYANRIAFSQFQLNGVEYNLTPNFYPHHLHGGTLGFDKKIWDYEIESFEDKISINLTTESQDMEEGYPGRLSMRVKYTYTVDNKLIIEYFATTDKPTYINLTSHCYFNLTGDQRKNIMDHLIWIDSEKITMVNESLIPTGDFYLIKNTVLDFNDFKKIGNRIFSPDNIVKIAKGYDHNYVLRSPNLHQPVAIAIDQDSGRRLQVYTDQPAVQLYTGNYLGSVVGKDVIYEDYAGFCLETQHYPDSPNHAHFPSTLLNPGDNFYSQTTYKIDCLSDHHT